MASMDCSVGPHFFKVFLPELSSQHLTIPPAFRRHLKLEARSPEPLSLTGPSGRTWHTHLVANSKGLCFHKGWKEFIADHSVQHGDFLLFCYDRSFHFTVWLFDTTACEKKSAFSAAPRHKESDRGGTPKKKKRKSDGCTTLQRSLQKKNKQNACGRTNLGFHVMSRKSMPMAKETGKTASPSSSQEARQVDPRVESEKDDELIVTGISSKKADSSAKSKPQIKQDMVGELQIGPLRSRRQTVTEQEVDKALEKAKSFKSKNPFVIKVMRKSYVYGRFFMQIPRQFTAEHLPMKKDKITLWDPNGKPWTMNYTVSRLSGRFSCLSWRKFSYAHNLEVDDVCVFELIEKNQFKVHIFRVAEKLRPLICA